MNLNAGPIPGTFNLNAQEQVSTFFMMDRCISKTKMDQKCGPNPMERVPGPEVGKKYVIFGRISFKVWVWEPFFKILSSCSTVLSICTGKFDRIAFRMQWNRSRGVTLLKKGIKT